MYSPEAVAPLKEDAATGPINPYGRTKHMIEQILCDVSVANPALRIALLRYFNPVGAHSSGSMGEDPAGIPNNLMPYVMQVAVGKLDEIQVFGDDYDTPDGTGVRDYIHVVDLARGHVAALRKLAEAPGIHTWNLGTLGPRQSKTVRVSASAQGEGSVGNCASVSYASTLCASIPVVSPKLRLTKTGPAEVLACDDITYNFEVSNTGTGSISNVRMTLCDSPPVTAGGSKFRAQAGCICELYC